MKSSKSISNRVFDISNYLMLSLMALMTVGPFIYVLLGSFSPVSGAILIHGFTLESYQYILKSTVFIRSIFNSVLITVVGTLINITLTTITAYPLSKTFLRGRSLMLKMIVFTMVFNAGLIPNYLVVSALGLTDTYWSLWIPTAINAFNLIVVKNFFQSIPAEIEEAAMIDGCNEFQTFLQIVLPLSKATTATFCLFYAVAHWNNFFQPLIYLNKDNMWPVQVWLRQMVILSQGGASSNDSLAGAVYIPPDSMKFAVIMVGTLPILILYPFLQKHFAKGVMLGSVKG